jgi:hypothetical protein
MVGVINPDAISVSFVRNVDLALLADRMTPES